MAPAAEAVHALLAARLIVGVDSAEARSRWALQVAPELWDAMHGRRIAAAWARHRTTSELVAASELILPGDTARMLERLPSLLVGREPQPVVVAGACDSCEREAHDASAAVVQTPSLHCPGAGGESGTNASLHHRGPRCGGRPSRCTAQRSPC